MSAVDFLYIVSIKLRKFPLFLVNWEFVSWMGVGFCQMGSFLYNSECQKGLGYLISNFQFPHL